MCRCKSSFFSTAPEDGTVHLLPCVSTAWSRILGLRDVVS